MAVQYLKVGLVILTYFTISISMIFANKYLVGTGDSEKDFSIFVAWVQCCVTVAFLSALRFASSTFRPSSHKEWKLTTAEHFAAMKQVMPMTVTYVSMLTFNNLCLKHVGVAFFQVARSMTLIFTVVFSILILHHRISYRVILCCIIVAGGFVLGIDQEHIKGTLSIRGVLYGVTTSLFVSLNGIYIKKSLDVVERDSTRLTYYNNINAIVLFIPFLAATGQVAQFFSTEQSRDMYFWLFLIGTGMLSTSMAWISAKQIDLTSPITHHIIANAKAVIQTLLAVVFNSEHKAILWWFSIFLVVTGATFYAIVRIQEDKKSAAKVQDIEKNVQNSTDIKPKVSIA